MHNINVILLLCTIASTCVAQDPQMEPFHIKDKKDHDTILRALSGHYTIYEEIRNTDLHEYACNNGITPDQIRTKTHLDHNDLKKYVKYRIAYRVQERITYARKNGELSIPDYKLEHLLCNIPINDGANCSAQDIVEAIAKLYFGCMHHDCAKFVDQQTGYAATVSGPLPEGCVSYICVHKNISRRDLLFVVEHELTHVEQALANATGEQSPLYKDHPSPCNNNQQSRLEFEADYNAAHFHPLPYYERFSPSRMSQSKCQTENEIYRYPNKVVYAPYERLNDILDERSNRLSSQERQRQYECATLDSPVSSQGAKQQSTSCSRISQGMIASYIAIPVGAVAVAGIGYHYAHVIPHVIQHRMPAMLQTVSASIYSAFEWLVGWRSNR